MEKSAEKSIRLIIVSLCILLSASVAGVIIQTYRLGSSRNEYRLLEQRAEISTELGEQFREQAANSDRELQEIGRSLQYSDSLVGSIREQIQRVREYCSYLESRNDRLWYYNNYMWSYIMENCEIKYFIVCRDDISLIENYELAKKDNYKGWILHHRLETNFSNGEERPINGSITSEELKLLGNYYNVGADELIFMKTNEHRALHNKFVGWKKGHKFSEETRKKISEANKGKKGHIPWNKGKKCPEVSIRQLGKSSGTKGKRWKLVDGKHVYYTVES